MKFAIIGSTGNVGRKTLAIFEKSSLDIQDIFLVASSKNTGKKIKFREKEIMIESVENYNFSKAEITFLQLAVS